jgi:hypothetical protein
MPLPVRADAITRAGAHHIALALDGEQPFARTCRAQAANASELDVRCAWEELAARRPEDVRRALAARGVVLFSRGSRSRSDRRAA